MSSRFRSIGFVVLALSSFLASAGVAQNQTPPKRGPSTAEERKRFVTLTRKLEQNFLDQSLYEEKRWAKTWLEDVPDINVTICAPLLFGEDFVREQNKYTPQLSYQATFGSAAYIIEHPDKAADTAGQFVAGVESALRAYAAVVKNEPQARSKALDDLLERQKQGKLADFVHAASKSCEDKSEGI
jgi:hypothetical protein